VNDNECLSNKGFRNVGNAVKDQNLKQVATVSVCLCEKHEICTGSYIDYTKTYVVKCACSCHNYNSVGLKGDK